MNCIENIIINLVRNEPSLYDKSTDAYHTEFRNRKNKFNVISQSIYQIFQKHYTGNLFIYLPINRVLDPILT